MCSSDLSEVVLLGQTVNSYHDGAGDFADLLRAVGSVPGIRRVRFTSPHPNDFSDSVVNAMAEVGAVCEHVHLPMQSGSSRVLRRMLRRYTREGYLECVDRLRAALPGLCLTTDIIVGFPGETEADFEQTKRAVEYCGFDMAYIFKYSPRPGTPAFEMEDDVTLGEKKLRFMELERIQKESQNKRLQRYLGKKVEVLAERVSSRSVKDITGHSTCHKLVNFQGSKDLIGQLVDVRIREIKANSLFGEVC